MANLKGSGRWEDQGGVKGRRLEMRVSKFGYCIFFRILKYILEIKEEWDENLHSRN
jgi:hypothetical protein